MFPTQLESSPAQLEIRPDLAESWGMGVQASSLPEPAAFCCPVQKAIQGLGLRLWITSLPKIREAGEEVPWRMGLQPDREE